jgi:hypothetical protein
VINFPFRLKPFASPMTEINPTPDVAEALAIFKPIIDSIHALRDEVMTVRGFPVFIDHTGQLSRIDQALHGWVDCWKRLAPDMDQTPLERLYKRLEFGTPITEDDIEQAVTVINRQIGRFMAMPVSHIKHHTLAEQISIELEQLGLIRETRTSGAITEK